MSTTAVQETVQSFHDHFNAGRVDDVLAMATDDVTIGGGRGRGQGRNLLDEWVRRKTTTLTPQRWFVKGDLVVIEELVEWRSRESGNVTDSTLWGMAFTVSDGKIAAIGRYADVGEAVTSSGMMETDEIDA
jgi:ketosteroid isomerase-like protein